ncbi:ATP synthase mitochondrial F1 complex assembly factor 2 [Rhizina undulata]
MSLVPRLPRTLLTPLRCRTARPLIALNTRHQFLHNSPPLTATSLPITAHGPPPKAPVPIVSEISEMRRRQKMLAEEGRVASAAGKASGKRRFWKEVSVVEKDGFYNIMLDTRAIRTPTKKPLAIPLSKPLLASAIALEWSLVKTSADALKGHRIPLTQLCSRAADLNDSELDPNSPSPTGGNTREEIVNNLIKYLDTDTLICWAPTTPPEFREEGRRTLRELQIEESLPIISWLTANLWPGVSINPIDGDHGLIPVSPQPGGTREIIKSWIANLDAWDLVGLERAVFASKSMLIAARLIGEWSENLTVRRNDGQRFGVEDAAEAASVEVRFQTDMWGEVEDTHDVEKEDLRRQLGAGVLLVAGNGR